MTPDLAGKVVDIVRIDGAIFFWTRDNWEIQLAGPALLSTGTEPPITIDVTEPGVVEPPPELAALVGTAITGVQIADNGDLTVELGDHTLVAPAARRYEAWQIGGHDGELLICGPGGGLTHFAPVPGVGRPREP